MRITIRGFAFPPPDHKQTLRFEDRYDINPLEMDEVLETAALTHAERLLADPLHMVEIEFMDEPDPLQRFFRYGTTPMGQVMPMALGVPGKTK